MRYPEISFEPFTSWLGGHVASEVLYARATTWEYAEGLSIALVVWLSPFRRLAHLYMYGKVWCLSTVQGNQASAIIPQTFLLKDIQSKTWGE